MLIKDNYDVVVVGGGSAGIAAAIGAVKTGARCLLIERNGSFGGQATNSNVSSYCGFFTNEETPQKAVRGVGEELINRLLEIDGCTYKLSTTGNSIYTFDEELLKYTLDCMVRDYELDVMLYCSLIGVRTADSGRRIESIRCMDDVNEYEFSAGCFVDASGDANLAYKAGASYRFRSGEGHGYPTTRVMRIDHVDPSVSFSPKYLEGMIRQAKADGFKYLTKDTGIVFRTYEDTAFAILATADVPSLDSRTLTECELDTRRQCQEYMRVFRKYIPGMENARLVSTGARLGLRDTRHVAGLYELSINDVTEGSRFDDSVARGAWPCEMHKDLTSMISYLYIKDRGYFSIPLRALRSKDIQNLYCAGRTISADPVAYASVRVMGTSFATGHAAGVAAAIASGGSEPDAETVERIRSELIRQNALI
ncbi:MAG: FAD-dependent oxidoreductase [Firmicutes bacterium]|nr:FAD-dependent oxidoreductase [Bacillota bacterium]